jgi:tetraacyldisaccharide 4'-kinase
VNPLSATYGALTYARNLLYDSGLLSARLQGPVISVGSISAGGAGKTPFVMLLGELLKQRGIGVDVLSRGYGRESKGVHVVDADGRARDFGDEPLLIAQHLSVPVVVGENRYQAGLLAEQTFGPQLHLLDDGFQHRALARDFDIVLLTEADTHDTLLPVGRLREPLASLGRADAVALVNSAALPRVQLKRGARVWRIRRRTCITKAAARPVVFCGIARPADFFLEVRRLGIDAAAELAFRDHHAYGAQDIERLITVACDNAANGFVTTEKDCINLGAHAAALVPLTYAKVQMELEAAEEAVAAILACASVPARLAAREKI